ncbi:DUF2982 domain-containing protein [Colwellia psychrerythraea]|uniref:DUF2982 domain-containing protein n=1 Tax=Colwellia psychrerythraea TaxID=28229 RepID=A0A099KM75_COLPS|nr:DUF2982 domain-containing protein [Colwellia psychrerythraea]KGJ91869.1 Protein of unknown function DUF2982 [Colwellia psychrerythraea]
MVKSLPLIKIKAQGNHHALFLMLLAVILFIITLTISQGYWRQFQLVITFLYLAELVLFITGLAKYLQPRYSLCLNPIGIKYQHSYGQWQLDWQQIQRISLMNETLGLTQIRLPYIGIRLIELSTLANTISPRLANRLIHEQRPLLALAIKLKFLTLEQSQINFSPFLLPSGEVLKGPLAAFMHHTSVLHKALGYHLFIPETALDRELNEFCSLLNQCKRSSEKYN